MADKCEPPSDWESFFSNASSPPTDYDMLKEKMRSFVADKSTDNKIVLVTSGGTSVPLESRTVRYLDNFSSGTRGAASAEYFLEAGYCVIFLHRLKSLYPFTRRIGGTNLLDCLQFTKTDDIQVISSESRQISDVLKRYKRYKNNLCSIGFITLSDYLHLLQAAAKILQPLEKRAMLYLAAAVSDFYIPPSDMVEHKIQSSQGALEFTMHLVPKMLKPLVTEWVPQGFVVSFKLETDNTILLSKSRQALQTYKHQMVIANILETRKQVVIMVTEGKEDVISMTTKEMDDGKEIEEKIVKYLVNCHKKF